MIVSGNRCDARLGRLQLEWQLSYPPTACREDCVRDCRRSRWQCRFAHSTWFILTVHQIDLDGRRFLYPDRIVAIEVCLLDGAVFHRDLILQGGTQSIDDRALRL